MRGLVGLGLLALCSSLSACSGASTTSPPTSSPTPNSAAQVAAVKSAVTAFIEAYAKSEETGDAKPVEKLTVPGSQAMGNAGNFASEPLSDGVGFKTIRLDIDRLSWRVSAQGSASSVSVNWSAFGYDVTYPNDVRAGEPHESDVFHSKFDLQKVQKTWLVASFS